MSFLDPIIPEPVDLLRLVNPVLQSYPRESMVNSPGTSIMKSQITLLKSTADQVQSAIPLLVTPVTISIAINTLMVYLPPLFEMLIDLKLLQLVKDNPAIKAILVGIIVPLDAATAIMNAIKIPLDVVGLGGLISVPESDSIEFIKNQINGNLS